MPTNFKTPGVYIEETSAFPHSIVQVATAIPAFIGYTPKATYEGKSYLFKPVKINSFTEFQAFFMYPDLPPPSEQTIQYSPSYYIQEQSKAPEVGDFYQLNGSIYTLEPDPNTIYYLYNSIRLFYENGGAEAYIVSVGTYGAPSQQAVEPGGRLINPNVKLADLRKGLEELKKVIDTTMYIFPEATLLSTEENSTLMQETLLQADDGRTSMAIFDVIGGRAPNPILWPDDIQIFRDSTGNIGLSFGAAYYPYLKTTVTSIDEISYLNLNGGDVKSFVPILNPPAHPNVAAGKLLKGIVEGNEHTTVQNNQALIVASSTYKHIMDILLEKINILPPSAAMAGIYNLLDSSRGVWIAPANISPIGVSGLSILLNDQEQAKLNVDPISGKSINVLRSFTGRGIMVWGARTLAGNSQDWRYINVRRMVTMIEQSIQLGLRSYIFSPNDANTWVVVKAAVEGFLTNIWRQGALLGAKTSDAFSVRIGLGETMTAQDVLEGRMRLTVALAILRPAEFIILEIEQEMAAE